MPLYCLCIVLTFSGISGTAVADGVIRDGLGAISCGRGGTNIAFADNGVVLYDNPAGLVNIEGCQMIDLGADLIFTDMKYADPDGADLAEHDPCPCGNLSVVRKSRDGCWAFGLGLYAPASFGTRYDMEGPTPFGGTRRYKSFGALAKLLPGISCRVTDRLSVGGTLGLGYSQVELEGPHFLQSLPLRGTPTLIDLQTYGAALAWSAGLQYELTPATTVGVTYQSETSFHLDGSIRVEVPDPRLKRSYFDADVNMMWPRSLGLGVRHELCPYRIVSADVIWFDWTNAFDSMELHLSDPSNPAFEAALGPHVDEVIPLNWRDTVSVRAGYERHFGCNRVARFGYTYHRNPIPAGTLTPYIQTTLEHTFTVGYGWRRGEWDINLAYQFTFGPDVEVAASDLAGGDFSGSRHEAQAHVMLITLLKRL
jgi:long-subunit fatty acid transport protein